jgi:hypothetical protein
MEIKDIEPIEQKIFEALLHSSNWSTYPKSFKDDLRAMTKSVLSIYNDTMAEKDKEIVGLKKDIESLERQLEEVKDE